MGVGNVFVFGDDLLRSDSDRMVSKSTPETGLWLHRTDIRTQSFAGVDRRWLDLDTGKCFRAESGRVDCPAPLQGCAFRAHQGLSARGSLLLHQYCPLLAVRGLRIDDVLELQRPRQLVRRAHRRYRCRATPHLSRLRQQRPHSLRLLRRLRARAGTNLRRMARALARPRPHRYRASSRGDCAPQPSYGALSRFPGSAGTGHASPTGLTLASEVVNFCL